MRVASFAQGGAQLFGARPWELNVTADAIEVWSVSDARLAKVDPDSRESTIAAGTVVYLLRLAMRCHRLEPEVHYTPDHRRPRLLARLTLLDRATPSEEELALFTLLSTPKGELTSSPLSLDVLAPQFRSLLLAANEEGACLCHVDSPRLREMTKSMLQGGDRLYYQSKTDRDSFRRWLGAPVTSDDISGEFVSWTVARDEISSETNLEDDLTAVLCTTYDDAAGWLKAGQALARIHLLAGTLGLALEIFNQPLQVPGMRARFARETSFCNFPQVIVRLRTCGPEPSTRNDSIGPCDSGYGGDCKGN